MPMKLPAPIEAYFAGKDGADIEAMLTSFAVDAIVKDEGGEMRGLAAIRHWMTETARKYRYTVEVLDATESEVATTVTCRLSGAFPGSPVDVSYAFGLADGKIASLDIS